MHESRRDDDACTLAEFAPLFVEADFEVKSLNAFAQEYETRGEKIVSADTVSRMNDKFYGQWLALRVRFGKNWYY